MSFSRFARSTEKVQTTAGGRAANKWYSRAMSSSAKSNGDSPAPGSVRMFPRPDLGVDIFVASATPTLSAQLPGNGGMRIWNYASTDDAIKEAMGLAGRMREKHDMYNTGFGGAKVVVNASGDGASNVDVDKKKLMSVTAGVLNDLQGTMYTGCDMNTDLDDMDHLRAETPYVLAGIPNLAVNPNDATAFGLLGSLEALAKANFGGVKGTRFVIHGTGNVGKTVAEQLVKLGADVYVYDISVARATSIAGAKVLSEADMSRPDWASTLPKHDIFVPCSKSNLVDMESALNLPAKVLCGSTNIPFATPEAATAYEGRGAVFVPESVSSAGAVIADSVEHFDTKSFTEAEPVEIYEFCRDMIFARTMEAVNIAKEHKEPISAALTKLVNSAAASDRIGHRYGLWKAKRGILGFAQEQSTAEKGTPAFSTSFAKESNASRAMKVVSQLSMVGKDASVPSSARAFSTTASGNAPDVCIVGAGIMGMNIAYQMKRRDPSLRVKILERAPGLGYGSSGWSTGFLRAFYSFDNTMELALDGINAYKNWGAYTGLGDSAEAFFTHTGALWMLGKNKEDNDAIHKRLAAYNVEAEVMGADDIKKRFPALNTEPYPEFNMETGDIVEKDWGELCAVYEAGCGHMDSSACLRDIQAACERVGVEIQFKARVGEILVDADKVSGVKMVDGSTILAGTVINCAGPWFGQLNKTCGVTTSTEMLPTRIQVGHKYLPDDEDLLSLPFVADFYGNSGIYFMPRRENKQLVFGSIAHRFESETVDPDNYNEALDPDVKQDYMACLFHRCPTLPQSGHIQGFSHMYTVNQDDVHPAIGQTKEFSNYFVCNGFSGHGFKLAPAVGSLVSQQVLGSKTSEWETSIPLDFLGANRKPLSLKQKTHFA